MKAAVLYWSKSGNTEEVALAIKEGLEARGARVTFLKTDQAEDLDWFDYDLVCVGGPSYQWHPGPHTGISEAIPAGKYLGQFFDHLGFNVLDEWYVVGEFHGNEEYSTRGRMGDIRGRPNQEDLKKIREDTIKLVGRIQVVSYKSVHD